MAKSDILVRSKLKKAKLHSSSGNMQEAKRIYAQLYSNNKGMHNIGLDLAIIHRKLGEYSQTEHICRNIISIIPKNAHAHHVLGSALHCMNNLAGAIEEYKIAISLDKQITEAHYFLANAYRESGQYELSVDCYKNAIKISPRFFEALNNLAAVLIQLHRPIEAKKFLDDALKLQPKSKQLLCNLADYYMLTNNAGMAMQVAKKVYLEDPTFIDAIRILGKLYYKEPDYDNALKFYSEAYELTTSDEFIGHIAEILERRGEHDKAYKLLQPVIERGTTTDIAVLAYSALSRKFDTQRIAIDAIEQGIKNGCYDRLSLISLHSELGKQYDSLGEYNNAFLNYKNANDIERELNKEMADLNEIVTIDNTKVEDIDKWFTDYPAEFWRSLPHSENNSERPVFVIGMFRSGTTLCEQILSSHPDVHGAGELFDINEISYSLGKSKLHDRSPASLQYVTQNELKNAVSRYLSTLDQHSKSAIRVVDKMPQNFMHVGLISLLFPKARIIHMIRDPRDSCLSMYFQRFGAQMTFSTDLIELANYHLEYQKLMEYWKQVLDIDIHDVVYEDLPRDQENLIHGIIDFCGLEWSDNCMNFHQSKRDINTPSYDQVRKPLYSKSVARWKNYESHIQPLINALGMSTN